ncbi:hypothetical protein PanWU01x14_041720 [Parasponia andersonii]|uniref:Uncharacterized protein n=1 Tax=Parasponia andersonii TaxID=3476 RepID=A0A2P5DQJ2_PARAD|nr:hypothetical protein PanWU01x14_041720 [Parasponia andersonii]
MIGGSYLFRNPVSTDYIFPNEVNCVCFVYGRVGFSLYPFGEIIYGQQNVPSSPWTSGELSDDVQTPLGEWPGRCVRMEILRGLAFHGGEPLALITFFDELGCLCHHVWPKVSDR